MNHAKHSTRYSELDWLRVGLIFAVFLHHVFMPFNGDKWHIMNTDSSKVLDDIMVYFEQIRLQILFFIAGAGSLILLQKTSIKTFLLNKFHRLFIPLIIGMMFIVPPQIYFEHINNYDSLFNAYTELVFAFKSNHLWFIEFLILCMLLAIPLNILLKTNGGLRLLQRLESLATAKHGLFSIVLLLVMIRGGIKYFEPSQEQSIDYLSTTLFFLFFFFSGMCFMKSPAIWQALANHRKTNLKWFVASSLLFYGYYFKPDVSAYLSLEVRWALWWLVCTLVSWSGLLAIVGYASAYLKKTPTWLNTTNQLIYPFYILHQTAIVIFAFYIVQWDMGIGTKSVTLLFSSLLTCALICYFVIRPFAITRYLFGLKPKQ